MNLVKKYKPDDKVIEVLTREINEFGLNFASQQKSSIYTKSVFDKLQIPKDEKDLEKTLISTGALSMSRRDSVNIKEVSKLLNADQCTNTLFYTANGCMPWHTNSDNPGTRIYVVFTSKPGIFRYKNPYTGEIVDDYDYAGWTQREFIVDNDNLLWHCVYSPAYRFSYGFNIK